MLISGKQYQKTSFLFIYLFISFFFFFFFFGGGAILAAVVVVAVVVVERVFTTLLHIGNTHQKSIHIHAQQYYTITRRSTQISQISAKARSGSGSPPKFNHLLFYLSVSISAWASLPRIHGKIHQGIYLNFHLDMSLQNLCQSTVQISAKAVSWSELQPCRPVHKISSQSAYDFLSKVASKQTDRQTYATEKLISLLEIINVIAADDCDFSDFLFNISPRPDCKYDIIGSWKTILSAYLSRGS